MTSKERHEARFQRRKSMRNAKKIVRSLQYSKWDDVFGLVPLYNGYRQSIKASRKRSKTQRFRSNILTNIREIEKSLKDGTLKWKGFNYFKIIERGKPRDIASVDISEKGLQNSFCNNYLIPIIRPSLIYDNGASLEGKGTDFALNRLTKHLRDHYRKYGREGGIYFFDFKSYFANIDVDRLVKNATPLLYEPKLRSIFEYLVTAFRDDRHENTGLGLGSQVSQISAVFYPNPIDHYVKENMRVHGYGRYMDDGYIIWHDIDELKEFARIFEDLCEQNGIIINRKKCHIYKLTSQFVYLKTRFFITSTGKVVRRINRKATKKEHHMLRKYRKFYDLGLMSYKDIYYIFHAWLMSQNRGNSFHVRLNMIRYYNTLFSEFAPYSPPHLKTHKEKRLMYIAKRAVGCSKLEPFQFLDTRDYVKELLETGELESYYAKLACADSTISK